MVSNVESKNSRCSRYTIEEGVENLLAVLLYEIIHVAENSTVFVSGDARLSQFGACTLTTCLSLLAEKEKGGIGTKGG